ncbi:hypothetical protein L3Q72_07720 [Vibrio sp. JC009]|uniref:hypothetical protein n=1 Tax=Vibrio sp. JC009 TaxID=2912314 RepID=UPI0023B16175|nr:hypothetical protein [Vibrio sp. JC009]WED20543.1 hypothetical protein L3Q72_07720 [Vibrio sp. JC009]
MSKDKVTGFTVSWGNSEGGDLLLSLEGLKKYALEISNEQEMDALTSQLRNQPYSYFDSAERKLIFTTEPIN